MKQFRSWPVNRRNRYTCSRGLSLRSNSSQPEMARTAAVVDGNAQQPVAPAPRYRVLAVASHPVQYMSPILRRMAQDPRFDLHVAYCSLRGAEAGVDPEFGTTVKWDVPLLDGYSWTHIPNRGSGTESFWGLRNPGLRELICEGRFDAVLCYLSYRRASFWIAYRAARSAGAAFLFGTDAVSLLPRNGPRWKAAVKSWFWPRLFDLADQVMVPSTGTLELMMSIGIPRDRITLTPYVVDNDWWLSRSVGVHRTDMRTAWGAAPDDLVILFCAKLQPWKRPADLLHAFAQAKLPRAVLVFAGEGPLRAELEQTAATLGIPERVRFLGFVNQSRLPAVYVSADVMVLPSSYEPFAVVVNEAMCCGCPVIASDCVGAARDLVAPMAPDLIFPAGDVSALAQKLRWLLGDPARLREVRRAAVTLIETWTPARNIDATNQAIRLGIRRVRHPPQTVDR